MNATPGSHIALMSVPLHGHVNPLLGLAAELIERGHRVTFATGDEFTELVEETGAEAVGYRSGFPSPRRATGDWLPPDDDGTLAVSAFGEESTTALLQLAKAYAHDVPQLVVYDTVTGYAPMLARHWGAGEVQFSPTHAFPSTVTGPAVGTGAAALTTDVPCVVALPRSLQFEADQISRRHVFVGPVIGRRRTHGEWTPPPGARRIALVSLGTTYNRHTEVFRACVRAVHALSNDWHVVVATGHADTSAELLADLAGADHVEIHTWVPQQSVLGHAAVFLTAGGTGSVLEGLAHGVPLVVLPQAVEQFVTARRVAELGVGRAVPPGCTDPAALSGAIRDLLADDTATTRLAAIRTEIAEAGGARAAADVVEEALEKRSAPSTPDNEDHRETGGDHQ